MSYRNTHIKFQHSTKGNSGYRSTSSVTLQIYGQSESAVLQQLKKSYPHWQDFVILEFDWKT